MVAIADAHRAEIERVCRDAEVARSTDALVAQLEAGAAAEALAEARRADAAARDALVAAAEARMGAEVVPRLVSQELQGRVETQLLPLQRALAELEQSALASAEAASGAGARCSALERGLEDAHAAAEGAAARAAAAGEGLAALARRAGAVEEAVAGVEVGARVEAVVNQVAAGASDQARVRGQEAALERRLDAQGQALQQLERRKSADDRDVPPPPSPLSY